MKEKNNNLLLIAVIVICAAAMTVAGAYKIYAVDGPGVDPSDSAAGDTLYNVQMLYDVENTELLGYWKGLGAGIYEGSGGSDASIAHFYDDITGNTACDPAVICSCYLIWMPGSDSWGKYCYANTIWSDRIGVVRSGQFRVINVLTDDLTRMSY